MKFEKLTDNKIRITLNNQDLIEKNINLESFLYDSTETQDLFLSMLQEAEDKIGFVTKDHQIKVEALAMADETYIVTITRLQKSSDNQSLKQATPKTRKIMGKKKEPPIESENLVYSFNNFEDFALFAKFVSTIKNFSTISKTAILYLYKEKYYLVFSNINIKHTYIKKFYTLITEFGKYETTSELLSYKLLERGQLILKNNALKQYVKYFESNK